MTEKRCECYATISEKDPRYEIWTYVRKDGHVPLKHPLPVKATGGPFDGQLFYEADISRLTDDERARAIEKISAKFNLPRNVVERDMAKGILPIKAENIIVSICKLHFLCMI